MEHSCCESGCFTAYRKKLREVTSSRPLAVKKHLPNGFDTIPTADKVFQEALQFEKSLYSLARNPKGDNVPSDVLEFLLSVEEVLAEQESQSEDSVQAVLNAAQVAVDYLT